MVPANQLEAVEVVAEVVLEVAVEAIHREHQCTVGEKARLQDRRPSTRGSMNKR